MVARYAGVNIRHFYPELTDDTVERLRTEAESPADKFIADLVAKRVAARDHYVVYGLSAKDQRFHHPTNLP